ncbi:MAG: GspE/PulE family protein [Candidatus Saccharimonadales bacterium]|nr:GspE/PulE family protein [Candidatus Saccharimonadales bacterium]
MRIADATVQQMLLDAGKIKQEDVQGLVELSKQEKKPLQDIVIDRNIVSDVELTQLYAKEIDVPYIRINTKEIDVEVLKLIPERIARKYNVALLGVSEDGTRLLAMADPDDVQAVDFLQKQIGKKLEVNIATKQDILAALDQYRGNITSEITEVISDEDDEESDEEDVDEEDLAEDSPIAQTVNLIIEYAIKSSASDIHIEAREGHVQVRYRVDGVLREANKLPKKVHAAMVSRIKILSNLKIDERRAPQDGRFKINLNGRIFAFRVSTLPTVDGEKVVMRVLDESSDPLTLEELGFWGVALNRINDAIIQPHGMLLVTGPTGSGKSTTLHSVLNILNNPDVNISTIEDPVEYRLGGVNQTQVNEKADMTFANGLRALLRQDPNIIMVGEIRDGETASLAVQAALTGHLVFSTLHTNNAATALPRLLDMEIEPFLIASTVRAIIGQRLVRRINKDRAETFTPTADEMKQIETAFGIKNKQDWQKIMKLVNNAQKSFGIEQTSEPTFWRPKELDPKDPQAAEPEYKGRMGIYEVLSNTTDIQKLIVSNGTSDDIQTVAIKEGMVTMQLDGLIKAMIGMTTIEEILRVTRE